jgi:hypothetical protein
MVSQKDIQGPHFDTFCKEDCQPPHISSFASDKHSDGIADLSIGLHDG